MVKHTYGLNHHEELRLEYLQKNIHYLNEREQRELAYLEEKAYGRPSSQPRYRHQERWEQAEAYEEEYSSYADDQVPDYPRKPRKPRGGKTKVPRKVKRKKRWTFFRLIKTLVLLVLLVIMGMVGMFFKGLYSEKTQAQANAAKAEVFHGEDTRDGVNILILGTDGRFGDSSEMTRTDSIMVLNINNKDKKVKMVSFMRDTLIDIEGYSYKLNLAYTLGEQDNRQGAEGVRQALKDNFDLSIKHYALVDFSTFATAIDTLFPSGVKIDAQFSTVDGEVVSQVEVPDDLNATAEGLPMQVIQVGEQRMDGRTLLNYARFRKDDEGDFGRTRRQQQVMAAILSQAKDPTKLFTGSEALGKVFSLTSTSIPYTFTLTNGLGAVWDSSKGVEQVTVPELGDWVDDYDIYDGLGLRIDFEKYKQRLAELGFR